MKHGVLALVLGLVLGTSAGCASYVGPARSIEPHEVRGPGWLRAEDVALVEQRSADDCGAAAVAMVIGHHVGRPIALDEMLLELRPRDGGLSAAELREAILRRGLRAFVVAGTMADLEHEVAAGRPVLVGTVKRTDRRGGRPHFEVVVALHPTRKQVVTLDPAAGLRASSYEGFASEWAPAKRTAIVVLPATGEATPTETAPAGR